MAATSQDPRPMLFNSFSFLAFFAVLAVPLTTPAPAASVGGLLLVGSLYFYAAFRVDYVLLLVGVTSAAYLAGKAIAASVDRRRRRLVFGAGVGAVLGALVIFKYFDFAAGVVENLLPVFDSPQWGPLPRLGLAAAAGLSFFTFSAVSYLSDVYAGRLDAEQHPGRFALYVSFFPKLLAGPIERAGPFLKQVVRPTGFSAAGVTTGLQFILWGLFKKVVVADRLAIFVDAAYAQPAFSSPADLVIATYFFAFQLYCDFFRLFRHRHRRRESPRYRLDGELSATLPLDFRGRILGPALAPLAGKLVSGLPVYPTGWWQMFNG